MFLLVLLSVVAHAFPADPFPDGLGPFRLVPVALYPRDFEFEGEFDEPYGRSWRINRPLRGELRAQLGQTEIRSSLSPVHPVTLGEELKATVGVVPEAAYFAFSYPVDLPLKFPTSWADMAEVAFLTVGGFVYYDEEYNLCQMMAFVPAEDGGLVFGTQAQWVPDWTESLGSNRFQRVTMPEHKEAGAQHFAWLPPGSESVDVETDKKGNVFVKIVSWFQGKNGKKVSQPKCPHGCFAYLFHDLTCDADPKICKKQRKTNRGVYFALTA